MIQSLCHSVSVRDSSRQQALYQRLSQFRNVVLIEYVIKVFIYAFFGDFVYKRLFCVSTFVKWMLARQHLNHNNAEGPQVDSFAVPLTISLLRGHEQDGAHLFI
jgi:hypothetical protein